MNPLDLNNLHHKARPASGHLILTHDLSLENFSRAIQKLYMSSPSIAITQFSKPNVEGVDVGFLGDTGFGDIRLVMNANALLPDGYNIPDNLAVYSNDVNTPMIPHIEYSVDSDSIMSLLSEWATSSALRQSSVSRFEYSISGYVSNIEYIKAVSQSHAVRYMFLSEVMGEHLDDMEERELSIYLDNAGLKLQGDAFSTFTRGMLEKTCTEKGMTLAGDFIQINDYTSEEELVDAFFEMYPPTKVGGLIEQLQDDGLFPDKEHLLEGALPNMFVKRFSSLEDIHNSRSKLLPSAGIDSFSHKDEGMYTNSMRELWSELRDQNPLIVAEGIANVCSVIDRGVDLTSEDTAMRLADMGVMVSEGMLNAIESCIVASPTKKVSYLEMKVDGQCSIENISHIVAPEAIGAEIRKILDDAGVDLPIHLTSGQDILSKKWERVCQTVNAPIEDISMIDRDGYRVGQCNDIATVKHKMR